MFLKRDVELSKMKALPRIVKLPGLLCLAVWLPVSAFSQHPSKNTLPKVRVLKDYVNTVGAIPPGCANHFLTFPGYQHDRGNIYISRPDGDGAMMNFYGRDTPLILKKTTLVFDKNGSAFATHEYRAGKLRITARFLELSDYISEYPATIVIKDGKTVRKLNLKHGAQCD